MNASELLNLGSERLKKNKIETHQLDSELVLSSLLKRRRENLLINLDEEVSKNIIYNFLIFHSKSNPSIRVCGREVIS